MDKYYDTNMSLMNCGGLTLVNKLFFPWCKQVMVIIRKAYTMDVITRDPKHSFDKSKKSVLGNHSLRSYFHTLCKRKKLEMQHLQYRVWYCPSKCGTCTVCCCFPTVEGGER
ncbi:hypothetical protein ACHAWF_012088 [Thalassiosira exigua]